MAAPSTRNIVPLLPTAAATLEIDLTPIEVFVDPLDMAPAYNQSISLTPIVVQADAIDLDIITVRNISLPPIVVETALITPLVGVTRNIDLTPIVVQVADVPLLVGTDTNINLTPLVVYANALDLLIATPTAISLTPIVVQVADVAPTVTRVLEINLDPIVVEVDFPTIGIVIPPGPNVEGVVGAFIYNASGVVPTGLPGHVETLIGWETHRYLNRIGEWRATFPAAEQPINSVPLGKTIKRGWRVSLVQDKTHPKFDLSLEYLLSKGVVEEVTYLVGDNGQSMLELKGGFNTSRLASRMTPITQTFPDGSLMREAAREVINPTGDDVEITNVILPEETNPLTTIMSFNGGDDGNDPTSRYERLINVAEYAHWAIREPWEEDSIELVNLRRNRNTYPDYTILSADQGGPEWALAGQRGIAIVAGTPSLKVDGTRMVNRIVSYGIDTVTVDAAEVEAPLTLQYATKGQPYPVRYKNGAYFLEDRPSINTYGLYETVIHREDVKSPTDLQANRVLAANALYTITAYELMRRRAPTLLLDITLANGPHIWALPGDMMQLQYVGYVQTEDGNLVWMEFDKRVLVQERHESGGPDVRTVSLVIAIPDLDSLVVPNPGYSPRPEDEDPDEEEEMVYVEDPNPLGKAIVPGLSRMGAGCCGSQKTDLGAAGDNFDPATMQVFTARYDASPVPLNSIIASGDAYNDPWPFPIGGTIKAVFNDDVAGDVDVYINGVLTAADGDGFWPIAAGEKVTLASTAGSGTSMMALFEPEVPGWFSYGNGAGRTTQPNYIYLYPALHFQPEGYEKPTPGDDGSIAALPGIYGFSSLAPYEGAIRHITLRRPSDDSAPNRTFNLYVNGEIVYTSTMSGPTASVDEDLDLAIAAGDLVTIGILADYTGGLADQLCEWGIVYEAFVQGWSTLSGTVTDGSAAFDGALAGGKMAAGFETYVPAAAKLSSLGWVSDDGSGTCAVDGSGAGAMSVGSGTVDGGDGITLALSDEAHIAVSGSTATYGVWGVGIRLLEEATGGDPVPPGS